MGRTWTIALGLGVAALAHAEGDAPEGGRILLSADGTSSQGLEIVVAGDRIKTTATTDDDHVKIVAIISDLADGSLKWSRHEEQALQTLCTLAQRQLSLKIDNDGGILHENLDGTFSHPQPEALLFELVGPQAEYRIACQLGFIDGNSSQHPTLTFVSAAVNRTVVEVPDGGSDVTYDGVIARLGDESQILHVEDERSYYFENFSPGGLFELATMRAAPARLSMATCDDLDGTTTLLGVKATWGNEASFTASGSLDEVQLATQLWSIEGFDTTIGHAAAGALDIVDYRLLVEQSGGCGPFGMGNPPDCIGEWKPTISKTPVCPSGEDPDLLAILLDPEDGSYVVKMESPHVTSDSGEPLSLSVIARVDRDFTTARGGVFVKGPLNPEAPLTLQAYTVPAPDDGLEYPFGDPAYDRLIEQLEGLEPTLRGGASEPAAIWWWFRKKKIEKYSSPRV